MPRRFLIGLAVVVIGGLTAPGAQGEVRVEKIGDFVRPVYVTGAPGDDERLYVVEQRGTIQVIEDGVARPFLDLRHVVSGPDDPDAGSEEGMASIAFPADFQETRRFYVYYTDLTGEYNRVDEFQAPAGDVADLTSQRLVIAIPHFEGSHHNGGQIQFGGGDLLYIAPGDGGTGGAPARDLGSLLGKLLRIDPRGQLPGEYSVPPGNPYAGQPGRRAEIWASGLRNPFRFSFDRATGDLTIGDVGEKTTEEINFLPAADGRGRGADFGWNACEGSFVRASTTVACPLAGSTLPAIERTRAAGYRSIINGYVVRDPSLPSLFGRLVYGDFYVDGLRSVQLGPDGESDDREVGPLAAVPRLTSFGEDAGGCVYATSFEGPVYRLVENDARIQCSTEQAEPPAPEDVRPPSLSSNVLAAQRLLRARRAVVHVRCDEDCRVTIDGRLRIGRRNYAVRPVTRTVLAGQRTRIGVPLSARARRALRLSPARGRRPRLTVRLRARDPMGNPSPAVAHVVRLRR